MTYEYSTDTGTADGKSSVPGEETLYGEPHHEVHGGDDEQTLYGDPQHESSDESADAWDVSLLFAHMQSAPVGPDELGSRTDPFAAESTER